jgi:hypothetical protein
MFADDEALHLYAFGEQRAGQQPQAIRTWRQDGVVVVGNQPTQRDTGARVQQGCSPHLKWIMGPGSQ